LLNEPAKERKGRAIPISTNQLEKKETKEMRRGRISVIEKKNLSPYRDSRSKGKKKTANPTPKNSYVKKKESSTNNVQRIVNEEGGNQKLDEKKE